MQKAPFSSSFQVDLKKYEYSVRQFWKKVWPLKWEIWKEPRAILSAISISTYTVKVVIASSIVVILISATTLSYNIYLSLTHDVPAFGGSIQEGVVATDVRFFNPVVEANSEAERKISSLLYHPLYTVEFPDYLNDSTSSPIITPILLSTTPEWVDLNEENPSNKFKVLRFTLKDSIKWSNGSPITIRDIIYSFDRIKEDKGNSQFKTAFSSVTIREVNENPLQFELVSDRPNPQLINASNFSPISAEYYGFQITDRLITDIRSFAPTVTSGYFRFDGDTTKDPDNPRGEKVANPIRDPIKNTIKTVVLTKNTVQNYKDIKLQNYIIRRADTLLRVGGDNDNSLQKLVQENKIDLFTRSLGTNLTLSPDEVASNLGLEQKVITTNTYYNLYLNIQVNDYFINQSLRHYVLCNFITTEIDAPYIRNNLEVIELSKRLHPIQLNTSVDPKCDNKDAILDPANYSIEQVEKNIKRVLLRSKPFVINLAGFPETEPLISQIQLAFTNMGVPAELIKESGTNSPIASKNYNALFIPVTIASRDPYPLLGSAGRDFSLIRLNNRIDDYNVESNLFNYSLSNLTDEEAKKKLVQFFSDQYVMLSLYRAKSEINYSPRIKGFVESSPDHITFGSEIYNNLPEYYINTKREWIF